MSTTNDGAAATIGDAKSCTDTCLRELKVALELVTAGDAKRGPNQVLDQFTWVVERRVPVAENLPGRTFMTQSLDASTHFQQVMEEIKTLYQQVTGKVFDHTSLRSTVEVQAEAAQKQQEEEDKRRAETGGE